MLVAALMSLGFSACADADPEFVHTTNFISAMELRNGRTADAAVIYGTINEYDRNGQILPVGFAPEDAEGGSGVIIFSVPQSQKDDFDLTSCYLRATVTWDEFISPSLSGLKNILVTDESPEGIVIAVKSGIGTVRKYRIMGYYE